MNELDKVLEDVKERDVMQGIEIANLKVQLRACINDLCCYCPKIQLRHLGACDDCKWNKTMEGLE